MSRAAFFMPVPANSAADEAEKSRLIRRRKSRHSGKSRIFYPQQRKASRNKALLPRLRTPLPSPENDKADGLPAVRFACMV